MPSKEVVAPQTASDELRGVAAAVDNAELQDLGLGCLPQNGNHIFRCQDFWGSTKTLGVARFGSNNADCLRQVDQ